MAEYTSRFLNIESMTILEKDSSSDYWSLEPVSKGGVVHQLRHAVYPHFSSMSTRFTPSLNGEASKVCCCLNLSWGLSCWQIDLPSVPLKLTTTWSACSKLLILLSSVSTVFRIFQGTLKPKWLPLSLLISLPVLRLNHIQLDMTTLSIFSQTRIHLLASSLRDRILLVVLIWLHILYQMKDHILRGHRPLLAPLPSLCRMSMLLLQKTPKNGT
jgi:hypothetical protein